jgi:hypothetical protein
MADEVKIYSQNRIDEDCVVSVTHEDADFPFLANAIDRDKASLFKSSGANSDSTDVVVEVTFPEARTIDRLVLVNSNVKSCTIKYWNGSAFASWGSGSALTGNDVVTLSPQRTTLKLQITLSTTIVANQEKQVGEVIACESLVDFGRAFDSLTWNGRDTAKKITLGDGTLHQSYLRFSSNRRTKVMLSGAITLISGYDATLALIEAAIESGDPFYLYPEPTARPDRIYLGFWNGALRHRYRDKYKGGGVTLDLDFAES